MRRQLVKVICNGEYTVIHDEKKPNPYKVYHVWHELGPYGYGLRRRQKMEGKYADYYSAVLHVANAVREHNLE